MSKVMKIIKAVICFPYVYAKDYAEYVSMCQTLGILTLATRKETKPQ